MRSYQTATPAFIRARASDEQRRKDVATLRAVLGLVQKITPPKFSIVGQEPETDKPATDKPIPKQPELRVLTFKKEKRPGSKRKK